MKPKRKKNHKNQWSKRTENENQKAEWKMECNVSERKRKIVRTKLLVFEC